MIAIPAIDLRAGACVQLVGGSYDAERVRLDNPLAVALHWCALGFRALHVVDLDAATERGDNAALVARLLRCTASDVRVGGGIRSTGQASRLLAQGARSVIVGTRALEDPAWLRELAAAAPGRVIVAMDARDGRLVTRGWTVAVDTTLADAIDAMNALPLAGILTTAVHVEGREVGPDLGLVEQVVGRSVHPVIAAGGIASLDDLRALEDRGATAAVLGMALYTGRIDAARCAGEFG
jgi:phosphoribosylformimino-5-aminoimidazole carboxamide ribotide isomerase